MKISKNQLESVIKLDPFKRYQYFIKRVADSEKIYVLKDIHGSFALSEIEENILLPFWSNLEYAEICKEGHWKDYKIVEIKFGILQNEIFPLIERENYLINVFPLPNITGFIVNLEEFTRDLQQELKKYE